LDVDNSLFLQSLYCLYVTFIIISHFVWILSGNILKHIFIS